MANKVQVIEKNEGTKIAWRQSGTKLIFGDDDLTINCATRERDWAVHADVCFDEDGNLVIGVGTGRYYVAQIDIPERQYVEVEDDAVAESDNDETEREKHTHLEPVPLDMSTVVLALWSIDDFHRNSVIDA